MSRAVDRLNAGSNLTALVLRNREINRRSRPQVGVIEGRRSDGCYIVRTANGTVVANGLSSGAMVGVVQVLQPIGSPIAFIDKSQGR